MNEKMIITIVLAVLILVSGVQAVQLTTLKNTMEEGGVVTTASSSVSKTSSGEGSKTGALPSSIKDLPAMVGGC